MVYDYGWRGSIPRPVAPTYWAEDVLKYAVATVPREKVYLGVPFYGYGWSEDFFSSYTYDTILFILEKYGVDFQYSPEEKTNRLFYVSDQDDRDPKVPHQIWFENHTSLEPKLELVKKYNIAGISIWRLGKEDNENWRRIRRILKNEVLPTTTFFQDVDAKTKYFTEIARLADLGIVKGMGGTNLFKPLTKINRAEVLKMALNSFARDISKYSFIETLPENFINPFKDIVQGSWFTHYVLTAVEMNIVKGYPDGTFKPEKNVTRAEALKLALESAEIKVPATTYSSLWYMPYKNWAVNHKLYTALNFLPHEEITRAEAAYIIAKVIAEVEK